MRIQLLSISFFIVSFAFSQNEYKMTNGIVRECKGIFKDSENGLTTGHYAHEEDYIFTICVPGSQSISWSFSHFCTELNLDYLKVFLGKDTSGSLYNTYSGTTSPGNFTINDSCVTFYFHSDKSVSCTGWEANWTSKIVKIPPLIFDSIPSQDCEIQTLDVSFNQFFRCDSVSASNFMLRGPKNASISSINVLNCNSDSFANRFCLNFNSPLDLSGTYQVDIEIGVLDICDSLWILDTSVFFNITNCPIEVEIIPDDSLVCQGGCTILNTRVTGGDSSKYVYNWISGNLSGPGPHTVCVQSNTIYILEVSDGVSVPGRDTFVLSVKPPPKILNDTTVCRNTPIFNLWSEKSGGFWTGLGVLDSSGRFRAQIAVVGSNKVHYYLDGCVDSAYVNVLQITPGAIQASCPGANTFQLNGNAPVGGFWTGTHTDSSGRFSPITSGNFLVTYNATNGCVASKWVYVDSVKTQRFDTICASDNWKTLNFSPPGGRWAGPGIINTVLGRFNPEISGPGDFILEYSLNGCRDTTFMHVVPIDAGDTMIVCPNGGLFPLPTPYPPNGTWSGLGVSSGDSGYFNPSHLSGNQVDSIQYAINGCTDNLIIKSILTKIELDSVSLCSNQPFLYLNGIFLNPFPNNGTWIGAGIRNDTFFRNLVTPGIYNLTYESNQCEAILKVNVIEEMKLMNDTSVCIGDYNLPLLSSDMAARWFGNGIINPLVNLFNPVSAGVGNHNIIVRSSQGCFQSFRIEVTAKPDIQIFTDETYCFKDSLFEISADPQGGTLTGNAMSNNFFNPSLINGNQSFIFYEFGEGNCKIMDSVSVQILPPLSLTLVASKDSICPFEDVTINAVASGGIPQSHQINWSTGHENQPSIFVFPTISILYEAALSDGCSNPVNATTNIVVNDLPQVTLNTSPILCYGQQGFAEVVSNSVNPLAYTWSTNPPSSASKIFTNVGQSIRLQIRDMLTNCKLDTAIYLESYPQVKADFFVTNFGGCVSQNNEFLPITNLSVGANIGKWMVSGFSPIEFIPNQNPLLPFDKKVEEFLVSLSVENEFGCKDAISKNYCIKDTVVIHLPTAFSPNNDKVNDVFKPIISEVRSYKLQIFNRWGEKIFESDNPEMGWDGLYQGKNCPTGYYTYIVKYQGLGFYNGTENGVVYLIR